jgi:hypothetical protein
VVLILELSVSFVYLFIDINYIVAAHLHPLIVIIVISAAFTLLLRGCRSLIVLWGGLAWSATAAVSHTRLVVLL